MSTETLFKIGDRVRILHSNGTKGRVVELRGPLAPKRMQVYGIRLSKKRNPTYVEVREDQLELLPKKGDTSKVESTELIEEKSAPPDNHN
jgi:hypothetical protein